MSNITVLKSKIHRAIVTDSDLDYEGSITIDRKLMDLANFLPSEQVHVLNISNGSRFITYVLEGKPDSGDICINGAAARLAQEGDIVIILAYISMEEEKAKSWKPKVVRVDSRNRPL